MNSTWASFVAWAAVNRDDITTISALVGGVGIVVAIIALLFTYFQLRGTKKALQAGNTYEIQRGAREIMARLYSDNDFNAYVFDRNSDQVIETDRKIRAALNQIGLVFHFYLSVYRQALARGVTKTLIHSMGKDFTLFLENAKVRSFYEAKRVAGVYDKEYEQMVVYWHRKAH